MTELVVSTSFRVPRLVDAASSKAAARFLEFFAANIRNVHTRCAYMRATLEFLELCEGVGVASIADVTPLHVATYIEKLTKTHSASTVKRQLVGIRHLFDWLVHGHVIEQIQRIPCAAYHIALSAAKRRCSTPARRAR